MHLRNISPLDSSKVLLFESTSTASLESIVRNAKQGYRSWSLISVFERSKILRHFLRVLESRKVELTELLRSETGKPVQTAIAEINAVIEYGQLLASHVLSITKKSVESSIPGRKVEIERIPFGVSLLITSHNTPLPNYAWKAFPALLMGNSIILKPSPYTCASAIAFRDLALQAGVPEQVFCLALGGSEVSQALLECDIDLVSFTGSSTAGRSISRQIGPKAIKSILEMGGNNPLLLLDDADIKSAIPYVFDSAFSNAGQRCAAGSRLILDKSIAHEFIGRFLQYANQQSYGISENSNVGPLIDLEAKVRFEQYLIQCSQVGAKVIRAGQLSGVSSSLSQPALILELDPNHELAKEEIFAPGLRIFVSDDDENALYIANNTEFGLTAAIWSKDFQRASRLAQRLEVGLVNINGPTHGAEPSMPFGGVKRSGNGTRDAGIDSLFEYSQSKVVTVFS